MRFSLFKYSTRIILFFLLSSSFVVATAAETALWVSEPEKVAVAVGNMTIDANGLGLTDAKIEKALSDRLSDAGLVVRVANEEEDDSILFLDLVVEKDTFVASIEFWRQAEYRLPDGTRHSDFVIVWEEYTIGAHLDSSESIVESVAAVLDSFIDDYETVNAKVLTDRNVLTSKL